ncbi:hypothetical protein AADG42_18985 [Ammonicoccus fulvus]|uniref:SRPBCC family protein n=1 Tax=Ammonicoccus fulvus TaxID=3138240 RepID=A0ABZ3FT89_9ACTN
MAGFEIRLEPDLSAAEAFRRILDLDAHTELIPFTVVRHQGVAPGRRIVARTGLGPVGFDDAMVIEGYAEPGNGEPGRCRIRKTGTWIRGEIELVVTPRGDSACSVRWRQLIRVWGVSAVADPVVGIVARVAYAYVIRLLLGRRSVSVEQ